MTIYSFSFENFFSFESETEISFLMDKRATPNERSFESTSGDRVSKVLAVIGANGSGKTNLIKPLTYVLWFITESFFAKTDSESAFIKAHVFSGSNFIEFKLDFSCEDTRYRYHLVRTEDRVYIETLHKKTSRLWSKVFNREWDLESKKYIVSRKGFGNTQMPLGEVGQNVSLISLAAQFKSKVAVAICENLKFRITNVGMIGRNTCYDSANNKEAASYFLENDIQRAEMARFLREQDFGVVDIVIEAIEAVDEEGKTRTHFLPWATHTKGELMTKIPLMLESSGTQAAYYLLSRIFPILSTGGIMIYDELEGDLHPLMLEPILGLFFSKRTNPFNAQLIFTTHSIEVVNLLQKSQVILVEKNDCCSEAWKLSEMEGVRSDDNFYAKYMSGAYGAVPRL